MLSGFSLRESLECRPEVVAQSRLHVVDEQGPYTAHKNSEWDVDDPVNAQVQNCEGKQNRIPENELVVSSMFPFFDGDALFTYMQPIQGQYTEWNRDVQTRYTVVKWVVATIEVTVPGIFVEQGFHARDVWTGDFDIEEQVVRHRKCVD